MNVVRLLGIAAVAVAAIGPAVAQDISATPNFGSIALDSGFTPDPRVIAVRSGGSIDAATLSPSCRGFISEAPDVRLQFDAGSLPLIISAASRADTTLVVNAPDGRWYCDDDGGTNALNPMIRFNTAQSGSYEIWVGTYGSTRLENAELHISELYSQ